VGAARPRVEKRRGRTMVSFILGYKSWTGGGLVGYGADLLLD
jgi:hypothetical protein